MSPARRPSPGHTVGCRTMGDRFLPARVDSPRRTGHAGATRRLTTASRTSLLLLAAAFVICVPAHGFVLLGVRWPASRVSYRINPNFPAPERSGTADEQVSTLRCAADAWREQSRADWGFQYSGRTAASGFRQDDVNVVSWVDEDGGDALAVTLISGAGNTAFGFDIVYFARSGGDANRWSATRDPLAGEFDIAGVGAHEFGHALGLDHTPVRDATMFASALDRGLGARTLHSDDRAGVEDLYGSARAPSRSPEVIAIEPAFGPETGGNEVTIRGRNLTWTGDTLLRVGTELVSRSRYDVVDQCTIVIHAMPGGVGSVDLRITNELGDTTRAAGYRYGPAPPPAPIIDSIEPAVALLAGGDLVTLRGANFTAAARVSIGGATLVDENVVDATTITGRVPAADVAGSVDVVVVQEPDTATLVAGFRYTALALRIGDAAGPPGGVADVDVAISTDVDLKGLSFAFSHAPEDIAIDAVTVEATAASAAEFASANIDDAAGVTTFGIVMSFVSADPRIAAGGDLVIARILARIPGDAPLGAVVPLHAETSAGSPPIELVFNPVDGAAALRPVGIDGSITVSATRFVRGDADGNGAIELTDAIFHLNSLFQGGPQSDCEDAADANDDGNPDISDAVYVLGFLFLGGDPPPAPFPEPGSDPTPDDLTCGALE